MNHEKDSPEQKTEAIKKEHKKYLEAHENLKKKRMNSENVWAKCYAYTAPRKEDVTSTLSPGIQKGQDLFDGTGIMSTELLAAALHGMLTNPSMRFFELIMGDADLNADEEAREWLEDSGDRIFVVMNNSNFQTEVHEIYIDEVAIGNACLFIGEHDDKVVHFNARAMKEIYLDENNLGLVDTVHREFTWKIKQIVQEFGLEELDPFLVEKYEKGSDDDFTIIHCVHPKSDNDKEAKEFHKFKSVYMLKDEPIFLSKDGFREFPYATPRWTKISGEVYGRGCGEKNLPDLMMVDRMMETTLKGAQKTVDPPLQVTDDGVIGKVRLTPGGLTIVRQGADPIRPLITDARVDLGYQCVEDVRKRIRSGFYVDQLQLNEGPQMTATEVAQRTEEKLRLMGPVLGRQHFEFLRPVIERVFAIMDRNGLLKPAPASIQGKKWDVRYSSLAARAQRASDGQNLSRAIAVGGPIINAKPESLDILNADEALKYVFGIYGVPSRLFNTEREIKTVRDGRAKAQEQLVKESQERHQADVASKVMPGAAQLQQAAQVSVK